MSIAVLVGCCLAAVAGMLPAAAQAPSCCQVTGVDARSGVVTARESTTGRTFQFKIDDLNLLRVLKPGQAVGADFQAGMAWVPPAATRYRIVSAGPAPAPGTMAEGGKRPAGPAGSPTGRPSGPAPCASPTTTSAAFLKIDGIGGESQDVCHKAEIELLSVQIAGTGASPAGAAGTGVTITKRIDKATPRLWMAVASGQHLPRATITLFTSSGGQPAILRYTLTDVAVTSMNQAVGPSAREDIVLAAAKTDTAYFPSSTAVALQPTPGPSSFEIFLKIPGVQGDSQDSIHRGETAVSSFTEGAHAGSGGGRSQFLPFVIQKGIDSASPKLLFAYQSGQHFQEAIVSVRPTGGQDLLQYRLSDVVVSAFTQTAGAAQREQVSLSFGRFEVEFWSAGQPGRASDRLKDGWDLKQNKRM